MVRDYDWRDDDGSGQDGDGLKGAFVAISFASARQLCRALTPLEEKRRREGDGAGRRSRDDGDMPKHFRSSFSFCSIEIDVPSIPRENHTCSEELGFHDRAYRTVGRRGTTRAGRREAENVVDGLRASQGGV